MYKVGDVVYLESTVSYYDPLGIWGFSTKTLISKGTIVEDRGEGWYTIDMGDCPLKDKIVINWHTRIEHRRNFKKTSLKTKVSLIGRFFKKWKKN